MSIISSEAERLYPPEAVDCHGAITIPVYTSDDLAEAYMDGAAYIYAMSLKRLKRKCERYAKRERKAIAYVATLKEES